MSLLTTTTAVEADRAHATSRLRRGFEAVAFVGVWMVLGALLPRDPSSSIRDANLYLLLGVPLTVGFQLVVRRRPLRQLWVRAASIFRLTPVGWAVAVALAVLPAVLLVQTLTARQWAAAGWLLCAVAGAPAAAFALQHVRQGGVRSFLHWTATATVTGVVIIGATLLPTVLAAPGPLPLPAMLLNGLQSALLYIPVVFILEEVSFRGALDPHVHQTDGARGWASALFVSVLWGVWHLPIASPSVPFLTNLAQVLLVHGAVGIPLSFGWRRTGSLAAPGVAHALIDGVRNGLLAGL